MREAEGREMERGWLKDIFQMAGDPWNDSRER